jgi:hypothetical protein
MKKLLIVSLALFSSPAFAETLWCRGGSGAGFPIPILSTYIVTHYSNGQFATAQQYMKINKLKQVLRGPEFVPQGFCAVAGRAMTDADPSFVVFTKPLLSYSVSFEDPNQAFFRTQLKTKLLSKDTVLMLNITSANSFFFWTDNADYQ